MLCPCIVGIRTKLPVWCVRNRIFRVKQIDKDSSRFIRIRFRFGFLLLICLLSYEVFQFKSYFISTFIRHSDCVDLNIFPKITNFGLNTIHYYFNTILFPCGNGADCSPFRQYISHFFYIFAVIQTWKTRCIHALYRYSVYSRTDNRSAWRTNGQISQRNQFTIHCSPELCVLFRKSFLFRTSSPTECCNK